VTHSDEEQESAVLVGSVIFGLDAFILDIAETIVIIGGETGSTKVTIMIEHLKRETCTHNPFRIP